MSTRKLLFTYHAAIANREYSHARLRVALGLIERFGTGMRWRCQGDEDRLRMARDMEAIQAANGRCDDSFVSSWAFSNAVEFTWQSDASNGRTRDEWYALAVKYTICSDTLEAMERIQRIAKKQEFFWHRNTHPQQLMRGLMAGAALPVKAVANSSYSHDYYVVDKAFHVASAAPMRSAEAAAAS